MSRVWNKIFKRLFEQVDDDKLLSFWKKELLDLQNDDDYHGLFMTISNHLAPPIASSFHNIFSLKQLQSYLQSLSPSKIIIFFDWDDTIVYSGTSTLIEPQITRNLLDYIQAANIDFVIITGRFWKSALHDAFLNIQSIHESIDDSMVPPLAELGLNVNSRGNVNFVYDGEDRIGIYYRNILFGSEKGRIIKNFLESTDQYDHVLFVDDSNLYLTNVASYLPNAKIIQREI